RPVRGSLEPRVGPDQRIRPGRQRASGLAIDPGGGGRTRGARTRDHGRAPSRPGVRVDPEGPSRAANAGPRACVPLARWGRGRVPPLLRRRPGRHGHRAGRPVPVRARGGAMSEIALDIRSVELMEVALPLVRPFRTSFGEESEKRAILVTVGSGELAGWGE